MTAEGRTPKGGKPRGHRPATGKESEIGSRRRALADLRPSSGSTHAGLWLDRYIPALRDKKTEDPAQKGLGQEHCAEVARLAVPGLYKGFFERWKAGLRALPGTSLARARTCGRMIVGLGSESVLETSIHLHRTYGVPCIPGSALKGLARSTARVWSDDAAWKSGGEASRRAFGELAATGAIVFHDALWIPETERPLALDVMTVHHPEYYAGGSHAPSDMDSPNPVPFLSATGRFLLAVTGAEEGWSEVALEILSHGLEKEGVGAKTAAGYGRMKIERERKA